MSVMVWPAILNPRTALSNVKTLVATLGAYADVLDAERDKRRESERKYQQMLVDQTLIHVDLMAQENMCRVSAEEAMTRLTDEINQIRIALGRVAVYEGLVEFSPTVLLVDELVRDHEELEARIDAVMHYLDATYANPVFAVTGEMKNEVARLLQGGPRVPDTIEEIDT